MRLKITKVLGQGREHPSKYGTMVAYPITVIDGNGIEEDVDWSRKPHSPAPEVGQELEADGTYPVPEGAPEGARPRLKGAKPLDEQGNPITRSQSASDGSGYGRATNPKDAIKMRRSAAQRASAMFVGMMAQAGIAPGSQEMDKWAALWIKYTELAEEHSRELDKDVKEAEASENSKPTSDEKVPF